MKHVIHRFIPGFDGDTVISSFFFSAGASGACPKTRLHSLLSGASDALIEQKTAQTSSLSQDVACFFFTCIFLIERTH